MKDDLTEQQTNGILKALDDAIEHGPWDESNFLRAIGKNLREVRENFERHVHAEYQTLEASQTSPWTVNRISPRTGQQKMFVSLYSSEGSNLQSWERILANLPRQVISRAVYADEESIMNLIKSKENKINEAYVAIYVNQADILPMPADKIPMDKLGKPLITLKDRSLTLDNIIQFVHLSGVYHYVRGRLIKNNQADLRG